MRLKASVWFWLTAALAAAVGPLPLLLSILLSAAAHEMGHILLLRRYRVPIRELRLTAFGIVIDAPELRRISYLRELAVTLSGAAVNLLLSILSGILAEALNSVPLGVFSGTNAVLCLFNLLPILPLDGGRALLLLLSYFFDPMLADTVSAAVSAVLLLTLGLLGIRAYRLLGGGALFLFSALGFFVLSVRQGLAKYRRSV